MHVRMGLVTSAKRGFEDSVVTCLFGLRLPLTPLKLEQVESEAPRRLALSRCLEMSTDDQCKGNWELAELAFAEAVYGGQVRGPVSTNI